MAEDVSTSALESEVYWSLENEVFIELRDLLVEKLDYKKTFSYLRSKMVIDRFDEEDMRADQEQRKILGYPELQGPNCL